MFKQLVVIHKTKNKPFLSPVAPSSFYAGCPPQCLPHRPAAKKTVNVTAKFEIVKNELKLFSEGSPSSRSR